MLTPMRVLSLILLFAGIGLAFSNVRLSRWILGWILLSGALLLQGFRSLLSYFADRGGVDATIYAVANDWMGLGFSLLICASMYMMREVFTRHRLAAENLRVVGSAVNEAIVTTDNAGTIAVWNQVAQRMFGYSEQEAQGRKFHELVVPERYRFDFENKLSRFDGDDRGSVSSTPFELAGLRKDGTEIFIEYSVSRVAIDAKWHAIYVARDVTARKRAEDEIRERSTALEVLSAKMLSSEEMEKKNLAFGLHEGLAQTLALVKMRIEQRLEQLAANKQDTRSLASVVPLLQNVISDIEIIATRLRPSSLDELGLLPAIDWFCRDFQRLHPTIRVQSEIAMQEEDVPAPLKIVTYRIIESAFTVIARHENTDQIALALQREDGAIALAIEDTLQDLRYTAKAEHAADSDLQALFGEARERTILSGGSFKIARSKTGGVTLRAAWAA